MTELRTAITDVVDDKLIAEHVTELKEGKVLLFYWVAMMVAAGLRSGYEAKERGETDLNPADLIEVRTFIRRTPGGGNVIGLMPLDRSHKFDATEISKSLATFMAEKNLWNDVEPYAANHWVEAAYEALEYRAGSGANRHEDPYERMENFLKEHCYSDAYLRFLNGQAMTYADDERYNQKWGGLVKSVTTGDDDVAYVGGLALAYCRDKASEIMGLIDVSARTKEQMALLILGNTGTWAELFDLQEPMTDPEFDSPGPNISGVIQTLLDGEDFDPYVARREQMHRIK